MLFDIDLFFFLGKYKKNLDHSLTKYVICTVKVMILMENVPIFYL